MTPSRRPAAVFLDRDGVINENRPNYVLSPSQLAFLPGVFSALRRLARSPYKIIIVTNQSPVGRGLLTLADAERINQTVVDAVHARGGRIDAAYLCPAHPDVDDPCRKPRPGMLLQGQREFDLDLRRSYLIGDAVTDYEAARAVGATGILVLTGRGRAQRLLFTARGYHDAPVAADLAAAVTRILGAPRA